MHIRPCLLCLLLASCQWSMSTRTPGKPLSSSHHLSEDDARDLVAGRFAAEQIYFQEDYAYARGGIAFTADGFNEELGIGYDYFSWDDLQLLSTLGEEGGDVLLDDGERAALEADMEAGGDAILVLESATTFSSIEERTLIETRIEEFILWLKENDRI